MERIRGQITRPVLVGAGAGLVVGLIIGLIFAWLIWPTQWVDQPLTFVRSDLQQDYLAMAIQSFGQTNNVAEAQRRWTEIGSNNTNLLTAIASNPPAGLNAELISRFAAAVQPGAPVPQLTPGPGTQAAPTSAATTGGGTSNTLTVVLVIMCLLTLVIGGLLAYLFVFRKRGTAVEANTRPSAAGAGRGAIEPTGTFAEGQEPPIVQYLTTYNLGNDLYDDSFSVDSPSGEFLGECGVGISETIGVGDPKKVTAFEVWLFDKNDIQTVTKVVMSQHAFNDPSINQRLASKGEPVLAEPGKRIVLETATLQLEASVINMNYGQGALPANSFFEQMTLRLDIWQKR
jgi:hypothetical protein